MNLDMPESTRRFIDDRDRATMLEYPYMYRGLWSRLALDASRLDDLITWCRANVGEGQFTWESLTFFFKREEDMMLFAMRWS